MSELEAPNLVVAGGSGGSRVLPASVGPMARLATALSNAWYELRKSRTASIGLVMLVLLFSACAATPWIATQNPIKQNYR